MKFYAPISQTLFYSLGFATVLGLVACVHEQAVSPDQLAASEAPVRAAEEAGADKIPAAALHLKLAREEITLAKSLSEKGDTRAVTVMARAQADAELALAMAQGVKAESEAKTSAEEAKAAAL